MALALLVRIFWSWNMMLSLPALKVASSPEKASPKSIAKKSKITYEEEDEEEQEEPAFKVKESTGSFTSLLKASLKDKVEKKIQEKEPKKVISFPKDKPTYEITLLE